jgi:hypothetical protein
MLFLSSLAAYANIEIDTFLLLFRPTTRTDNDSRAIRYKAIPMFL